MKHHIALVLAFLFAFSFFPVEPASAQEKQAGIDRLLPADTLLFLGVDDYALFEKFAESMPLDKILKEEEVVDFLKKPKAYLDKKMKELNQMVAAENEQMATDMDKFMNFKLARCFFAVTHIGLPSMDGEGGGNLAPDLGLAMGFSLKGDADSLAFVKGLITNMAKSEGMEVVFQPGDYQGVKYETMSLQGVPMPFFVHFFHVNDMLVITTSEKTMKSMVGLQKGSSKDSLAGSGTYQKLTGSLSLSSPGSANLYVDLHRTIALLKEGIKMAIMFSGEMEYLPKVDVVADKLGLSSLGPVLSRSLSKDGVARSEAVFSLEGKPTGIMAAFPDKAVSKEELEVIPKNVMSVSLFRIDMAALYDLAMDVVQAIDMEAYQEMQEGLNGFCAALSADSGSEPIDIRRDILGQFGSGCIFYQLEAASMGMMMPSMNFLIEIKDFNKLAGTIKTLFDGLTNMEPEVASTVTFSAIPFQDQEIHYFQFADVPMMTPCFAKVGDYMAFGLQLDDVKKLIKRQGTGKGSILENEDFTKLYGKLAGDGSVFSVKYTQVKSVFSSTYNSLAMSVPMMTMMLPPEIDLPVDLQLLPTADCIESYLFSSMAVTVHGKDNVYKTSTYGPMGLEMMKYAFPVLAMGGFMVMDYFLAEIDAPSTGPIPEPVVDESSLFEAQVRADLAALSNGCFVYKIEFNKYPDKLADLLVPTDDWPNGFYNSDTLPMDPWGSPYSYKKGGADYQYIIWSWGPDKVDGGGSGDDIVRKK